jgi:hypothetical protein
MAGQGSHGAALGQDPSKPASAFYASRKTSSPPSWTTLRVQIALHRCGPTRGYTMGTDFREPDFEIVRECLTCDWPLLSIDPLSRFYKTACYGHFTQLSLSHLGHTIMAAKMREKADLKML